MFVKLIESPGRVVAQPSMTKFQGWHPIQLRDWQAHWDHWGHEILGNILKRNTWKLGAWGKFVFYVLSRWETYQNISSWYLWWLTFWNRFCVILWTNWKHLNPKQILDSTRAASQPTGAGTAVPGHLRSIEWEWMVPISSRKLMTAFSPQNLISCAILTPFNLLYFI